MVLSASLALSTSAESPGTRQSKNHFWFCSHCDIQCNSDSQFDVHMISQKHKFVLEEEKRKLDTPVQVADFNNNLIDLKDDNLKKTIARSKSNFSMSKHRTITFPS
jgi:hypothetical protein